MYIKQIISVHPRSSCTIFCAKCGTALLKIRPFEGFAPQLYPENPKMRYSSTQAPASPSTLASRISLHHISRISLLPGFRGFSLRHSTYGSLRRCTEPAIARKGRGTGEERRNRRRTGGETAEKRKTGEETAEPSEKRKTSGRTGEERKNGKERKTGGEGRKGRRNGGTGGETEEPEENRETEGKGEERRGREEVINRRGCANCIEFQRFLRKLLINKK